MVTSGPFNIFQNKTWRHVLPEGRQRTAAWELQTCGGRVDCKKRSKAAAGLHVHRQICGTAGGSEPGRHLGEGVGFPGHGHHGAQPWVWALSGVAALEGGPNLLRPENRRAVRCRLSDRRVSQPSYASTTKGESCRHSRLHPLGGPRRRAARHTVGVISVPAGQAGHAVLPDL